MNAPAMPGARNWRVFDNDDEPHDYAADIIELASGGALVFKTGGHVVRTLSPDQWVCVTQIAGVARLPIGTLYFRREVFARTEIELIAVEAERDFITPSRRPIRLIRWDELMDGTEVVR
jgi:hypothetical protein